MSFERTEKKGEEKQMTTWDVTKRRGVWEALRQDDPQQLAIHLTSVQIREAYTGLWNPKKYRKECGKKDTHLLDVMLLQKTGVNHGQGGALRCYAWLNTVFPEAYTAEEKEWVMRRYQHSCLA